MSFRTPDEVRASFDALRLVCDPRGHDLLAELERLALCENAMLALHQRMQLAAIGDDVQAVASPEIPENGHAGHCPPAAMAATHFSLPDKDGYPLGHPKLYVLREAGEL